VEIAASPDEVWESLATEEGRSRWLEDDPEREMLVEVAQEPDRLVWWWWREDEAPRRVEFTVVAVPEGARVIVVESAPEFPMAQFTMSFAFAFALA
jgi:uncharacterized protein YndB with AHSA1/START domain